MAGKKCIQIVGDQPVALRIPSDLISQADDLMPALARKIQSLSDEGGKWRYLHANVTRSTVLRLAIYEGLKVLAADLKPTSIFPSTHKVKQ